MIPIHELNHVLLNVSDLVTSEHFYGTILELPRISRPDFRFPGAWFALGQQELHLAADPDLAPSGRRHHHFGLRVDDTFEIRARLEAKGVHGLLGPSPRPDGAMQLFLHDPDGYLIEFMSSPPKGRLTGA